MSLANFVGRSGVEVLLSLAEVIAQSLERSIGYWIFASFLFVVFFAKEFRNVIRFFCLPWISSNFAISEGNQLGFSFQSETDRQEAEEFICQITDTVSVKIVPTEPPKFAPGDPLAVKYLEENGYVVFRQVASAEEISTGINLFWKLVEGEAKGKIQRTNPQTWTQENGFPINSVGIVAQMGIGNSEFLWFCRGLPPVAKAFASVWGDESLLTSMDGCGVFAPHEVNRAWRTHSGWFHVDQNGHRQKTRICVQGLLNFFPSGPTDGGLVVVPKSHLEFASIFEQYPHIAMPDGPNFAKMTSPSLAEMWKKFPTAHKLNLQPGDFCMWDSRTIHCNHPASTRSRLSPADIRDLRRLVAYVCMTPVKFATDLDALVKKRVRAFQQAQTTSHWPHEFRPSSYPWKSTTFVRPVLNEHQRRLLVGTSAIDIAVPIPDDKEEAKTDKVY